MPVQTLRVQTLRKIGIHPEGTTPDEPTVTVDDTPMTTPPYEQRHDSINQEGSMHDDTPIMVDDTPLSSSGYKKRPRLGIIPDFRIPKTAKSTALEATIRKFRERKTECVVAHEPGMEFDSLPEAYVFSTYTPGR